MKRLKKCVSLMAAAIILSFCGCSSIISTNVEKAQASKISLSEESLKCGKLVSKYDDHGGFHGDGSSMYVFSFDAEGDNKITSDISSSKYWNELPLSENLSLYLYGGEKNGINYGGGIEGIFDPPEISHGYYFVHDRYYDNYGSNGYYKNTSAKTLISSESLDGSDSAYTDKHILDGYSTNLTVAIYDTDSRTLYIMEFDT